MKAVELRGFAGLRNTLPPERLRSVPGKEGAVIELTTAGNVDIDDSGRLARRAGQTMMLAGSAHSLWAEGDMCLYAADSTLCRLTPELERVELASITPGAPVAYVAVGPRVYWSNGVETGVVDGQAASSSRSWGMAEPVLLALTPGAGQLSAGTYQVALTFSRRDGQESGCTLPAVISLDEGASLTVSWRAPDDPDLDGVNVYLSEPNGMVPYLAGRYLAEQGGASIVGARLALPLATQWLDAPPAGQCLGLHNGRILIGAGAFVYATTALGYEYVDLRDYLALDGSRIGFIAGVRHGVYIGTAKGVYFCAGERLEEYTVKQVVAAPCVARSAVLADAEKVTGDARQAGSNVVLFATGAGICLGREDGSVQNLTASNYEFDASASGAAVFRADATLKQYLLFQEA
jgi:hypothetical protein